MGSEMCIRDRDNDEKQIVPEIREIFANNTLGQYKVNLNAGTNYLDLKELNL